MYNWIWDFVGPVYPPHEASTRIVGGTDAEDGEALYQCSLQTRRHQHFCGCAVINSKFALTAAHCTVRWIQFYPKID